jgi:predicted DNA-binding ribbon-helix-helix protein
LIFEGEPAANGGETSPPVRFFMHKRSVTLKGHRTSIALEAEFWNALDAFAREDGKSLASLVTRIDRDRLKQDPPPGLASALRVYVLRRASDRPQ